MVPRRTLRCFCAVFFPQSCLKKSAVCRGQFPAAALVAWPCLETPPRVQPVCTCGLAGRLCVCFLGGEAREKVLERPESCSAAGDSVICFAEMYFQKPFSLGGEKEPDVQNRANPCASAAARLCVSRHAPRAASRPPCG